MNDQTIDLLAPPPTVTVGSLESLLGALASGEMTPLAALHALVAAIRPPRTSDLETPTRAIRSICHLLIQRPELRSAVRLALLEFLAGRRPISLYVDAGLYPNNSFLSEFARRLSCTVLPRDIDASYLRDVVAAVFDRVSDARWIEAVDAAVWQELFRAFCFSEQGPGAGARWMNDLIEALRVLSYRIAAVGLEPELLRVEPTLEAYDSPFVGQNIAAMAFVGSWQRWLIDGAGRPDDGSHLRMLFDQSRKVIDRIRVRAAREGTSMSLTLHLKRLRQNIGRAEHIMDILAAWSAARCLDDAAVAAVQFCRWRVVDECRKNDVRAFWRDSVELLARRVTDNASRVGEHYITASRGEYFGMFRSAAVAGFFIALMALSRLFIGQANLAPLVEAWAICLNYGIGFVLIHIVDGTVATKQPAMTAAAIAAAVGEGSAGSAKMQSAALDRLASLIARTVRSQLVAIFGNLLVAVPVAMLIGQALGNWLGAPYPDPDKARHLLDEVHPWQSAALIYAAIAGVCLFLSGLISGYYDNLAAYNRIPQRIFSLRPLRRLLGKARLRRIAAYLQNHLGALAGNFFFGFLIGGVTTVGILFRLPIDVRHITFSSAYFGYAANTLDYALDAAELAVVWVGIGAVGAINLFVSFTLSLWIGCRSRKIPMALASILTGRVWRLLRTRPREFFLPPRGSPSTAKPEAADSASHSGPAQ